MTGESIEHVSRETAQGRRARTREQENKREKDNSLRPALESASRTRGRACSFHLCHSLASGPRASSLIPTPVRLPVSPLSLLTLTFSRTLASRTARTP